VSLENVVQPVRRVFFLVVVFSTLFGSFHSLPARAEDSGERKVKVKIAPSYPELARKMGLTGMVKLEVVIARNGSVKETKVIGGHPILVNAAVDAVKKWKFETANSETIETVQVNFDQGY
jgi:TonB family protein